MSFMPELPDVEGFRRVLVSCAQGRGIDRVEVADPGVLHGVNPRQLRRDLEGHRFTEPERRGKWLLAHTDGPTVVLHFGMTGQLVCSSEEDPPDPHDRLVFVVGDNQLRYRDQRKLQGVWLTDAAAVDTILGPLGPDALTVDRAEFEELLHGRRGGIKSVLMDQSVIAGLGNLLSDEILWRARLHPARRVGDLTDDELRRLYDEMRRVLRDSVRVGHIPTGESWLNGRRDSPDPTCPRCGGPLRRSRIAGRSALWCPRCQQETP